MHGRTQLDCLLPLPVLSVEYGSWWVGPLLHKLHHVSRLYSKDMWRFGPPPERPDEMIDEVIDGLLEL